MTIALRYTVSCDTVSGQGVACAERLQGIGNAIKAVADARERGWDVRRHEAYCPYCTQTALRPSTTPREKD